jgi:hypothetical protein
MGWWATDTFGGDMPLDIVGDIEEQLGIPELYPVDSWSRPTRHQVREAMTPARQEAMLHRYRGDIGDTPEHNLQWSTVTQVLTCIVMASGAELSGELREAALQAAQQDIWAQEDQGRRGSVDIFASTVEDYKPGTPTTIPHKGLVQTLLEHTGPGPVNIQPGTTSRGSNQYKTKTSPKKPGGPPVGKTIPLITQASRHPK